MADPLFEPVHVAGLEHHPTKRDHPSDKDARQNKELEHDPIRLTDSTRSDHALALRKRIVMAPMTHNFSPDGLPGENVAAHYRRRAVAEMGLIVTERIGIDHWAPAA